jgi:hypothetical protein
MNACFCGFRLNPIAGDYRGFGGYRSPNGPPAPSDVDACATHIAPELSDSRPARVFEPTMTRRLRSVAVAVAVAILIQPAAACADTRVVATGAQPIAALPLFSVLTRIAGPVLAGTHVVWAESRRDRTYGIERLDDTGAAEIGQIGSATGLQLAAAGSRVAYARHDISCPAGCPDPVPIADEIAVGSINGDFAPLDSCPPTQAGCAYPNNQRRDVAVTEDAIAFRPAGYNQTRVIVRHFDPAGGDSETSFDDAGRRFALAGPYLAVSAGHLPVGSAGRVDVYDHRNGAPVYSLQRASDPVDLQADGKLLYFSERGLAWASPDEPYAHPLTRLAPPSKYPDGLYLEGMRFAGDRIVLAWNDGRFVIKDLAGATRVSPAVAGRIGQFDFDGRRLVWAQRPCAVISVSSWDIADRHFPGVPLRRCPLPSMSAGTRPDRLGRITVRLRCLSDRLHGCPGYFELTMHDRRYGEVRAGGDGFYELFPGKSGCVYVPLQDRTQQRLRHAGRLALTVKLTALGATGGPTHAYRVVLRPPR